MTSIFIQPSNMSSIIQSNIVSSTACFIAFTIYGMANASFGAAVPTLMVVLKVSESNIGVLYVARGIGFLFGTLSSSYAVRSVTNISKELLGCWSMLLIGLGSVFLISNCFYQVVIILMVLQGLGFGFIDTMANCALPELWKEGVQPWMQALHFFFGVGAMIGPALVGVIGYQKTYLLIGCCSITPLGFLTVGQYVVRSIGNGIIASNTEINDSEEGLKDDEDVLLKKAPDIHVSIALRDKVDIPVPYYLRLLISVFYFVYAGSEIGFAAWIADYAIIIGATHNANAAAFVPAVFWFALTVGRLISIFTSMVLSASWMLRIHLLLTLLTTVLLSNSQRASLLELDVISASLGIAYSAIYPLMMTVALEYGYVMDAETTSIFMIGATLGEGVLPLCVGAVIDHFGGKSFTYLILSLSLVLIIISVIVQIRGVSGRFTSHHSQTVTKVQSITTDIEIVG